MATEPMTPGPFQISSYTDERVNGRALKTSDGGSPILQWQLAWGTKPTTADFVGDLNLDGSGFVAGLTPGTTYYFWSRTRNAVGWSPLSPRVFITMKNVPDTPPSPGFINKEQTAITAIIAPGGNGGSPITNYILGYALSTTLAPPLPTDVITHAVPGRLRGDRSSGTVLVRHAGRSTQSGAPPPKGARSCRFRSARSN